MPEQPEQPEQLEQPEQPEPDATEVDEQDPAAADEADAGTAEPEASDAPAEPVVVDPRLFDAHDLARAALAEVTPESTIGESAGYAVEDGGVVSLRFANRMDGYPGWFWTVSVAVVEGAEPTVLEVELLPGDGALLAPEWLPWAERLAEYQAAQAAAGEDDESDIDEDDDASDDDEDEDDAEDGDDLDDAADFDSDGSPILHAGDVDGVDIDELDETAAGAAPAPEDDEDESDDEDEDDESDEDDDGESLREY